MRFVIASVRSLEKFSLDGHNFFSRVGVNMMRAVPWSLVQVPLNEGETANVHVLQMIIENILCHGWLLRV